MPVAVEEKTMIGASQEGVSAVSWSPGAAPKNYLRAESSKVASNDQ
ncbi:MAG: hypothetical protein H6R15_4063 [Proteobacteria bacterium]|nr:hypothetical protein [Pseudomonadota bacterium]